LVAVLGIHGFGAKVKEKRLIFNLLNFNVEGMGTGKLSV